MYSATETIKLVQLLDAFCEAFNRHDPDAIVSMITDDCEFRPALGDKQFGASIKGKSAIKEAFINTFAMFPDAKWVPRNKNEVCLLYTSPSPRDRTRSRMPSSA